MHYHYRLEPYTGKYSRYTCPACQKKQVFTRYVSRADGQPVAPDVGRCNREVNCGYHRTPAQHFEQHGRPEPPKSIVTPQPQLRKMPDGPAYIPDHLHRASFSRCYEHHLKTWLCHHFTTEQVWQMLNDYEVGSNSHWPGATVFWQRDVQLRVRYGKVMLYNPQTGKRVKEPFPHFTTIHSLNKLDGSNLKQCLFGEHLLRESNKPIAIVESEKTALIASVCLPEYTWLATGGLGGLTEEKCKVQAGRKVTLFPDANAYHKWSEKARELQGIISCSVSPFIEHHATDNEKQQGWDIGDYLVG